MFVVPARRRLVNAGDTKGVIRILGASFWMPVGALRKSRQFAVCECKCGTTWIACVPDINNGKISSCGCLGRKTTADRNRKTKRHGMSKTRLYAAWHAMKVRCFNKNCAAYLNYGGRGITVCESWLKFEPFMEWSMANGYSDNLEIDRIDNNGHYEPSNCRWTTTTINSNNRRNNIVLIAFGERKTMGHWSRDPRCLVTYDVLAGRIRHGWHPEKAMTTSG